MFSIKQIAAATLLIGSALTANAGRLWIIGDATPGNWDMNKTTALLSMENSSVYTGTIYLLADKEFKFLTEPDWGNLEYGAAPDAVMHDGTISLAEGRNDEGYSKLKVNENANYFISVDTDAMTATITKSPYQQTEITFCSLFLVGGATPGNWTVMDGTPLYQSKDQPYEYSATNQALISGDFKIATTLVGAAHWDSAYWYFRDADNRNKIVLNQEGDLKWDITEAGDYDVTVNVLDNSISITKSSPTGITDIVSDEDAYTEYYTVTGIRTETPANGIFICKNGNSVSKIYIK